MNFQYSSGKKFRLSSFSSENYGLLRKDEQRTRLIINITFLLALLLLEYVILTVFTKF
jgi:hypothetical protein